MKTWLRKPLIWTHRYLGMALSLLFLMWFLTGIGMIYSRGMPRLSPEMRMSRLAPVDLDRVNITAAEAARSAGVFGPGGQVELLTVLDRPAYRFTDRGTTIVFADTGKPFTELELDQATTIASRFLDVPESRIHYSELMTRPDQWTLTLGRELPMYKFAVDDDAGTEVYVAPRLGEVVQLTTTRGRALAWVSVIPHFMYFQALRMNGDLWVRIMVWGPGIGVAVALLGLLLGVVAFKPSRPFRFARIGSYIPYKGWLRWHYIAGMAFGALALGFVFSGLLSMEPWEWTTRDDSLDRGTRAAFPDGSGSLSDYPAIDAATWRRELGVGEIKEVAFTRILGEPHFVVRNAPASAARMGWPDGGHQPYFVQRYVDPQRWVIAANPFEVRRAPIANETILSQIEQSIPNAPIISSETLDAYDSYYYSRERRSPLPVVRVKLDDADKTWLYIDAEVAQVVGRINRVNRAERWLYAALHTFDFPFLYNLRPLWVGVIVLFCLGGAAISGIGVILSFKRIVGGFRRVSGLSTNA